MKTKVLVFPCGSEIGLEINNALKYSTHVELFGASSVDDHGKFVYANYIENIPHVDDDEFIRVLNEVIKKHNINLIFPAHDSVVLKLAQNQSLLKCNVIGSPLETCKICRSKLKTYEFFKNKISVPHVYKKNDKDLAFPVFLKPDVGQGSKGVALVNSMKEMEFCLKKDPSLLILEYLPGKEYTIDCFTNKEGQLLFAGARERSRISNGISVNTFPVRDEICRFIAEKINSHLKLRGAWFFQLKKNENGELILLEIAPRIAGSMALYRNLDVNLPLLSVFDALGIPVSVNCNRYGLEMDRALGNRFSVNFEYDNVYVDLDDTIIFNGKINPLVMSFLYQCLNNKIKIHLLTRHKDRFGEEAKEVLRKYKIADIFSSIIDIKKEENKSDYIKKKKSIFIDDSFRERAEVREKNGIPVFEVSSLESLINWKS